MLTAVLVGWMEAVARHPSSPVSFIVLAGVILAVGIALGLKRRQVADFFVDVNGGGPRRQAINRVMFHTGIPIMAVMFIVFGAIFEVYGWVKLL